MKEATDSSLEDYCRRLDQDCTDVLQSRQAILTELGAYIARNVREGEQVKLVVICTHNSRRSHIGQLWLQTAAQWYGIPHVETYSGGTEATAFHKNAIAALQRAGFQIEVESPVFNPVCRVTIPIKEHLSMSLFSKTYDNSSNPTNGFVAIMVCSEADAECPFVPGAEARFAIPFDDPKQYDGTSREIAEYDKNVRQIGAEMFYTMRHAASLLDMNQQMHT